MVDVPKSFAALISDPTKILVAGSFYDRLYDASRHVFYALGSAEVRGNDSYYTLECCAEMIGRPDARLATIRATSAFCHNSFEELETPELIQYFHIQYTGWVDRMKMELEFWLREYGMRDLKAWESL